MKEKKIIELIKEFELTANSRGTKNGFLFLQISKQLLLMAEEKGILKEITPIADTLKESIDNNIQKIDEYNLIISELKELIEDNQDIIDDEKEIKQDYEDLLRLKPQIELLQRKHSELRKVENNLKDLRLNLQNICSKNDSIIENNLLEVNKINKTLGDSTKSLEIQLKEKIKVVNKNVSNIKNKHIEVLDILSTKPLETIFKNLDQDINQLVIEYNVYVDKIKSIKEDLDEISEKYSSIFEVYKKHHFENEEIFGHLQSKEGVLIYMESLNAEIKKALSLYDEEINRIVKERDELPLYQLEEIRKYQHVNG